MRLAYVALTRARCQVVAHWAPAGNTRTAPLHRLLFGAARRRRACPTRSRSATTAPCGSVSTPSRPAPAGRSPSSARPAGPGRRRPPAPTYPALGVRGFDRTVDLAWVRTSYSGLTAGLHDEPSAPGVSSESEQPGTVDEPVLEPGTPALPAGGGTVDLSSPMAALPKGAAFGTLVHGVLEHTDFAAPDLRDRLVEQCDLAGSQRYAGIPAGALADALLPSLLTPLGPLAGGRGWPTSPARPARRARLRAPPARR